MHGVENSAYLGTRGDVQRLVPASTRAILDVGCAAGALGRAIKVSRPWVKVQGIERDEELAARAECVLDNVVVVDLDCIGSLNRSGLGLFDCIIFADVLEHLKEPWAVVSFLVERHLCASGVVVFSLPNISHVYTFVSLLQLRWPYLERGIFDRTHLRMFAKKNIDELLDVNGLVLESLDRNLRIHDRPKHWLNRFSRFVDVPLVREYFTYQFLVVARKKDDLVNGGGVA